MSKNRDNLKWLKDKQEFTYNNPDPKLLDTFDSPGVSEVMFTATEFTSLCPITGQPDVATIDIIYAPNKLCLESKSLKIYLGNFRQFKGFAESITKKIGGDLDKVLKPKWIEVVGWFGSRGGIKIKATHFIEEGRCKDEISIRNG
jgi:7-cyano-7-deazaguanine reductase